MKVIIALLVIALGLMAAVAERYKQQAEEAKRDHQAEYEMRVALDAILSDYRASCSER